MNIIGVIPARMGSSRFPGKPLAKICGKSMIEHVYKRTKMAKSLIEVYVATCDEEIKKEVEAFGGIAVMTKDTHERASDRVAEAMLKIENETGKKVDVLVMIQGDEPLTFPEMIDEALGPIKNSNDIKVVNLLGILNTKEEQDDRNEIKVVVDNNFNALYFSREPIPTRCKIDKHFQMYKQVCIIPFRRDYLLKFNSLPQTPLEIKESVDMMRILEHGDKVKMVLTKYETYSVDNEADLKRVEEIMKKDKLYSEYK